MKKLFFLSIILENDQLIGLMLSMIICLIAAFVLYIAVEHLPTLIGISKKLIKIKELKKEGYNFRNSFSLDNGNKYIAGSSMSKMGNNLQNYLSVLYVDPNYNRLKSIIDGIGEAEFNSEFEKIRVIKNIDGIWMVGFMDKSTGKVDGDLRYDKATPLLPHKFRDVESKEEFVMYSSMVYLHGSELPTMIHEKM